MHQYPRQPLLPRRVHHPSRDIFDRLCCRIPIVPMSLRSRSGRYGTDVFPRACSQAAIDRPNATERYTGGGLIDFSWSQKTPVLLLNRNQPLCLASASALTLDPPCIRLLTARFRSSKPSVVLAHLTRTHKSLAEHGENIRAEWAPDGSKIVIQVRVPCFLPI